MGSWRVIEQTEVFGEDVANHRMDISQRDEGSNNVYSEMEFPFVVTEGAFKSYSLGPNGHQRS